jgi:hypothetical protein
MICEAPDYSAHDILILSIPSLASFGKHSALALTTVLTATVRDCHHWILLIKANARREFQFAMAMSDRTEIEAELPFPYSAGRGS